ncbi:CBS domain-containing protein [Alkalilimnicola sp. S0819]|uniref:CBS domain-containing protein n=1 Tax=Alkalilimnicola sp. S0819 TaxID=2613922 RepID=UPI0012618C48|nr:CBS domain-containing protein [Alkalilimnicola sp. S0819]KAB7628327.1 CBS domain-containing protein [Alkalilimnicola sp. S0819]MPQ15226.1 CBS domain-containing protein [Alkalilimnicola sp. S0819]
MSQTVADVMTRKLVFVQMDDPVRLARALFEEHGFHHLLVLEREGLAGVLSDRDLLRTVSPYVGTVAERERDLRTLERPVHQIMSRRPLVIHEHIPVARAAALMVEADVSCLPVVSEQGAVRGILTRKDVLRWCAEHLDSKA